MSFLRDLRAQALYSEIGRQDPASLSTDISSGTIRGGVMWVSPEWRSAPWQLLKGRTLHVTSSYRSLHASVPLEAANSRRST